MSPSAPATIPALGTRARISAGTMPGRYRLWSVAVAVILALAALAATASATRMRSSTRRAHTDSGPVLVATQQLVSSLAEADAAASAAFLSGRDEDPEQRRQYEQALGRATQQVNDIASLTGANVTIHVVIERVAVQLTRYAGLVEAARASNKAGVSGADTYLTSAVRLATSLVEGDVRLLTTAAQASLRADENSRTGGFPPALLLLVCALAVLALGQAMLVRRSRRILNPPLVVALVLTVAAFAWLTRAGQSSGHDLASARRKGYDSIVITARLSSAGFGAKAEQTLAVITGDAGRNRDADTNARAVAAAPVTDVSATAIRRGDAGAGPGGLLGRAAAAADSPRERAAVAEAALRWERYLGTVAAVRAAPDQASARTIATGPANADFNGFNFSIEAILGQNRDQFLAGLASAAAATSGVSAAVLLLVLGAVFASLVGFQVRINEYR